MHRRRLRSASQFARQRRHVAPGSAHSPAPSEPFLRTFMIFCQHEKSGVYGGGTAPLAQQYMAAPSHYHPYPDTRVLLHLNQRTQPALMLGRWC